MVYRICSKLFFKIELFDKGKAPEKVITQSLKEPKAIFS